MKTKTSKWTAEEKAILERNLSIYPVKEDAVRKTAEKIGRTANAVRFKVYAKDRPKAKDKAEKLSRNTPVITYHNGTTRVAQLLINKKDLIVAKMDDVVITIQY